MIELVAVAATAYVVGAIPVGLWVARAAGGADPRATGSRSTGATNVARAAGARAGIVTALLDGVKGAAAAAAAGRLAGPGAGACAAVAVVVGHAWPPWAWRGGGKGVATAAGGLGAIAPVPAVLAAGVFAAVLAAGRRVSLASLASAAAFPAAALLLGSSRPVLAAGLLIAGAIAARHRDNVARLLDGTEPKVGRDANGAWW